VPLAHGVRMNGAIFNSRLLAYPDLGHLPMEEAPAKTAAEARAFVNGLTAN
jgi:pimeloyl-ACP methyl ester carboxylesterase